MTRMIWTRLTAAAYIRRMVVERNRAEGYAKADLRAQQTLCGMCDGLSPDIAGYRVERQLLGRG